MTFTPMHPAIRNLFDWLCRQAKGTRGPGLTLNEISACAPHAPELEYERPDRERIEESAGRLKHPLGEATRK